MPLLRRSALTLAAAALAPALPGLGIRQASAQTPAAAPAPTPAPNAPGTERAIGPADAKVVVHEWFSLTCSHCAEFQKTTFPRVKKELIDTGRIRYVWRDYPLDQVALMAAAVARSLPPERYEPFVTTLLSTQDRWAFTRGVNSMEEIAKIAALAGMPRQSFDAAVNDAALKQAIITAQDEAEKKLGVTSTPSFLFNGKLVAGAISFASFQQAVDTAQS